MAQTRVTNTSGASQYLGFLPPHGKTLANGAEVVIEGDLRTILASGRGRYTRKNEETSLAALVAAGDVVVQEMTNEECVSSSLCPQP